MNELIYVGIFIIYLSVVGVISFVVVAITQLSQENRGVPKNKKPLPPPPPKPIFEEGSYIPTNINEILESQPKTWLDGVLNEIDENRKNPKSK